MSYTHFTINDRICIQDYLNKGYSINKMSKLMKRSKSSISEEIRKNSVEHYGYIARIAQEKSNKRKRNCKWEHAISERLKNYIEEKLMLTWSPEQISERLKLDYPDDETMRISFKTIYTAIYNGNLNKVSKINLRRKGKKYNYKNSNKGKIKDCIPMSERPESINNRENVGDWETDTVKGKKGTKACLATFADRKLRYYIAVRMSNNTANNFNKAADTKFRLESRGKVNSFNCDNGKEFSKHKELSKKFNNAKVYFAKPHAPWEKGTNENGNGLLREIFPKGTSFEKVTQEEIDNACRLINNRPRKCLNWHSAAELFEKACKNDE